MSAIHCHRSYSITHGDKEYEVEQQPADWFDPIIRELPNGNVVIGYLSHDDDVENPCTSGDGVGMVRSFSNRHINNIDPNEAVELLKKDKMVVALSYFEHGNSLWDVHGGGHYGSCPDREWDGVDFAGVWIPDDCCRDEIKGRSHRKHISYQSAARELAKQCCDTYTSWANGDC